MTAMDTPTPKEIAELERLVAAEPVTWRPDQNDSGHPKQISGRVLTIGEVASTFGNYPLVEIEGTSKVWRFHAMGAVARNELNRLDVRAGDLIAVRDLGEAVVRGGQWAGQKYRAYRMVKLPNGQNAAAPQSTTSVQVSQDEIPF